MPRLVEKLSDYSLNSDDKYYTLRVRAITSPKRIERLYGTLLILPEELQKAYKTLEGKPVLKDHTPSVDSVVGKVTQTEFKEGAIYATLSILKEGNENLIRKIEDGLLNGVSVGFTRKLVWDDKENAYLAKDISFNEISLVVFPADKDATILSEEGEDILSEAIAWVQDPERRKKAPSDYFLDPSSRKYPYRTWDGKISCELLRRALSLSALHKHSQIYDRAKSLYEKHCKKENQGGVNMDLETLQKENEELKKQVELLKKEVETLKELAEAGKAYIEKLKAETKKFVKLLFGEKSAMLTLIDGLSDIKQLEAMHEEYKRLAKERYQPSVAKEGFTEEDAKAGELTAEKLASVSFEELLKLREKFLQEV